MNIKTSIVGITVFATGPIAAGTAASDLAANGAERHPNPPSAAGWSGRVRRDLRLARPVSATAS